MKSLLAAFYLSLFFSSCIYGQTEQPSPDFSFTIQNGISQHRLTQGEFDDDDQPAYVNALRLQFAFGKSQRFRSLVGLQYGKTGYTNPWD